MKVNQLPIEGLLLFELQCFHDERGFFVERYNEEKFSNLGLSKTWVQDNFSRSTERVLRGLHYQYSPQQGKLVTCLNGIIWDVAVDLRRDSASFGKHYALELDGRHPQAFWIPAGFAHGFCVLSGSADVMYKVDQLYEAKGENGIKWNDPDLNIPWPVNEPILSPKDECLQSFQDFCSLPDPFSGLES